MKHAYLILAHEDFDVLRLLLRCLDVPENDIYIHFDRKVRVLPSDLKTKTARLSILKNRVRVYWGDYSMVKAEYLLFEAAVSHGPYLYYHLLSGVDLPIKNQAYIQQFFQDNQGKEFIDYLVKPAKAPLRDRRES